MQIFVRAAAAATTVVATALIAGCAAGTHSGAAGARPGGAQAGARPAASASPAGPSGTAACSPVPAGSATTELTLTPASVGRTYCVRTGEMVRVLFFGLPQAWLPMRITGDALVPAAAAGSRKLMPSQPSILYRAVRPGTATLTASRLCAPLHPVSESQVRSGGTSACLGRAASFRVVIIVS